LTRPAAYINDMWAESFDRSTYAVIGIASEHHEIHEGDHYYVAGYETEALNGTIEFVVTTPDTTKWAHLLFTIQGSDKIQVDVYEGTTGVTGGAATTPINNNRNSSNTSGLTLVKDPASITDDGTVIAGYSVGALKTTGEVKRTHELVLKQNTAYLFRATSLANSNIISYEGTWYEHQNLEVIA